MRTTLTIISALLLSALPVAAQSADSIPADSIPADSTAYDSLSTVTGVTLTTDLTLAAKPVKPSIYSLPYSMTGSSHNWRHLWQNTATLAGCFVGTLLVLECLPEDATTWNRAELREVPLFRRWHNHVLVKGPEWDHDRFIFNYVLHPYAGAVYYMAARSCGFNVWQSLLYGTLVSNVGWEFGIEAFMERPSYQDMLITPIVGSAIGECFYRLKRNIVRNDYCLFGSSVFGNIVAFFIDPVNEVLGLIRGNPAREAAGDMARKRAAQSSLSMSISPFGCSLRLNF